MFHAPQNRPGLGNIAAGGVRGAGSIGATMLTPYDLLAGNTSSWGNPERRSAMDAGLQELGADPTSLAYKTGKLGYRNSWYFTSWRLAWWRLG